ncbi:hypothetical protein ACNKHK_11845 [Shigella flexneri]
MNTVAGFGLSRYTMEPWLNEGELDWREGAAKSLDSNVIATLTSLLPPRRHQSAEWKPRPRSDENVGGTGRNQVIEAPRLF